jgi:hypothetical protein
MIVGNSLADAWASSLALFLDPASLSRLDTIRGPCFEARDIAIRIESPSRVQRVRGYPEVYEPLISSFADRFLDEGTGRNSTLAARLYRWPRGERQVEGDSVDQIAHARTVIREQPEARFNIVAAWDPAKDPFAPSPVSPLLGAFQVRADAVASPLCLHATLVVRALDAWLGAVPMFAGFAALQHSLAEQSTVGLGSLTVFILSYHVYELDLPIVRATASPGA